MHLDKEMIEIIENRPKCVQIDIQVGLSLKKETIFFFSMICFGTRFFYCGLSFYLSRICLYFQMT